MHHFTKSPRRITPGAFYYPCAKRRKLQINHYSLITIHFNDVYFRGAEEAHAEDGTDAASDKDAAVAFEVEEACGHGGAQGDEITGEGVAELAPVCVAGEHEVPVVEAESPAAFGVVREEEHGVLLLPRGEHAGGRGIISFVPVAKADDAEDAATWGRPVDGLVAEDGDSGGGKGSLYLLEFFVVLVAEYGVGGGDGAELSESIDGPSGAHESLGDHDEIAAEDDEVWFGGFDVVDGFAEEASIVMQVGKEGDAQGAGTGQGALRKLDAVALQLRCAVFPEKFASQAADKSQQGENNEPFAEFSSAGHGG